MSRYKNTREDILAKSPPDRNIHPSESLPHRSKPILLSAETLKTVPMTVLSRVNVLFMDSGLVQGKGEKTFESAEIAKNLKFKEEGSQAEVLPSGNLKITFALPGGDLVIEGTPNAFRAAYLRFRKVIEKRSNR